MTIKYRICWKSSITESEGCGKPIFDSLDDALSEVERANAEHNQIRHPRPIRTSSTIIRHGESWTCISYAMGCLSALIFTLALLIVYYAN